MFQIGVQGEVLNFVKFSDSDTQTLENVARGELHEENHGIFHDTLGREKEKIFTPLFCRVVVIRGEKKNQ